MSTATKAAPAATPVALSHEDRMKTLIICTDFSESALNAAKYACRLANLYKFKYITLFHAYQLMMPPATTPLATGYTYNEEEMVKSSMEQLKKLKNELSTLTGNQITINTRSENMTLGESIDAVCEGEKADMVVMGSSGKSKLEKIIIGSNAVNVSQKSHYPVLIVPPQASFEPIQNILLTCDLNEIRETTPLESLERILELFGASLFILNVDDKNRNFSAVTPQEIYQLHHTFDKYKPQYAFVDSKDTIAGITNYAEENNISLIINIPKNYNIIEQLFHRSTTKKLIYESLTPLLTLHE